MMLMKEELMYVRVTTFIFDPAHLAAMRQMIK